MTQPPTHEDVLSIGGRPILSRLLVGTGKYANFTQTRLAVDASGAGIVTVAIRRINIGQQDHQENLLDFFQDSPVILLPNSAWCFTATDAISVLQTGAALLGHNLVKLEILGDADTLYPNMEETFVAARVLVRAGLDVMVYCNDDPIAAKKLEEMGCVAIMPLASLIGSGMGVLNPRQLQLVRSAVKHVPLIIDAGVGTASDASIVMELGADGVLLNTAIACAQDPITMALAMKHAVIAGRLAYCAGRMTVSQKRYTAQASSPTLAS